MSALCGAGPRSAKGYREAGLKRGEVDHGTVTALPVERPRRIGIVVYEYGLFVPASRQAYFCVGKHLYAGNAVLYSYDKLGITHDFDADDRASINAFLHFFADISEIMRGIENGALDRPVMRINEQVLWQWPDPAPKIR